MHALFSFLVFCTAQRTLSLSHLSLTLNGDSSLCPTLSCSTLYLFSQSLHSLTLPWIATKSHYEPKPPRAPLSQVSTFPQICYLSHRELQLNNHSCLSQVSTFLPNLLFKPEPPLSQLINLGSRVPLNSCNYHRFTVTVSHHETLLSARHRPSLWATIITMYAILLLVVSNFIALQYCYADQLIIV